MTDLPRRPSMTDVAALAGVSHQTVSRVLNGHPHVRPDTAARVRDAITTLGYRPNSAARALASRRSRTIGLVFPDTSLHGPVSALLSLEQAARAAGYHLAVTTFASFAPETVRDALDHFREHLVEAVTVIAPEPAVTAVAEQLAATAPVVLVSSDVTPRSVARVGIDQHGGIDAAMRLLLDLGHRRIALVAGPPGDYDADLRLAAWRAALDAQGLPAPDPYPGSWSPDDGYAAGRALAAAIEQDPDGAPTAVLAANDHMALGVLHAAADSGLDVPGDLSVVGFDDIVGAGHLRPPLTTVRPPFAELGAAAMTTLVDVIEGRSPDPVRLATTLVPRATHAPPRPERRRVGR